MLDGSQLPASPRKSAKATPFQQDLHTGIFLRRDPRAETSARKGLSHPALRCERTAWGGGSHSLWSSGRGWVPGGPLLLACFFQRQSLAVPWGPVRWSHTHTCTHTHAHVHMCVHTRTHTSTHTYSHTDAHTCIHTCTHMHTHMHSHTCAHTHTCTHTHAHTHMHAHRSPPEPECRGQCLAPDSARK